MSFLRFLCRRDFLCRRITSNKQFLFRLVNRLANHVAGFPEIESFTVSNVHNSNRDEWATEQLQSGLHAIWPVQKRVMDFFVRYELWALEKVSEASKTKTPARHTTVPRSAVPPTASSAASTNSNSDGCILGTWPIVEIKDRDDDDDDDDK